MTVDNETLAEMERLCEGRYQQLIQDVAIKTWRQTEPLMLSGLHWARYRNVSISATAFLKTSYEA